MSEDNKGVQEDPQVEEVVEMVDEDTKTEVESEEVPGESPKFTKWDFAHLHLHCSRCGNDHLLQEDIEDGLMFTVPTTDMHNLILECPTCKNTIKLHWIESLKKKEVKEPETTEVTKDETVQEESKED